ncbi:MAG: hypothetical protein KBT18_00990 [Comamonas sp.]|nr:hypothetical protein [Candidatus Comamonas equi]
MAPRTSPAVCFPLQGAGVVKYAVYVLLAGSAAVLLVWWYSGAGNGNGQGWWLRWLVGMVLWLVGAALSLKALKHIPCGYLQWTGVHWWCDAVAFQAHLPGAPQVLCDCGWALALRWRTQQGQVIYCWLQRDWAPAAWPHVRRAVYLPLDPVRDPHGPGALP